MRALSQVDADLEALKRPKHPGCAGVLNPTVIKAWLGELTAWKVANPEGTERYAMLLEEREAIENEMSRLRARQARIEASALPKRVAQALLQPRVTQALTAAREWADGEKQYLLLAGSPGTGKSVAAGYALMRLGKSCLWVQAGEVAVKAGGFGGEVFADSMKTVDALVVDDFGTEHESPFAKSLLFEVLASRHEEMLRTILTTNLDGVALKKRLGERLADRIRPSCSWVQCAGESLRGRP